MSSTWRAAAQVHAHVEPALAAVLHGGPAGERKAEARVERHHVRLGEQAHLGDVCEPVVVLNLGQVPTHEVARDALAAVLGPSIQTTVIVIGATVWSTYARVVRADVLSVRERDFVLAARAIGAYLAGGKTRWPITKADVEAFAPPLAVATEVER